MLAKNCLRSSLVGWILGGCIASIGTVSSLRGQESDLAESSLSVVPADVAFYSSTIDMRESLEQFRSSTFVQRLRAVPYVVQLEAEIQKRWDDPEMAQAKGVIESPTASKVLMLAEDMFANEFFAYGGDDWCNVIEGLMEFQSEFSGVANEGEDAVLEYFNELTAEDVEFLRVPTTVFGFRLTDEENARLQLDALEGVLRLGLGNIDQLKPIMSRLRRSDFKDGQSLSITLDTALMPPLDLPEEQQEFADHMLELMKGRQLSIEMGVKNGTMLIVFSEKGGVLRTYGESEQSLLEHEAFGPLREQAPESLRNVSYASERWRASQWNANVGQYFENLVNQFSAALSNEGELIDAQEEWLEALEQDAQQLDEQLVEMAPEFGPMVAWAYATDNGMEGMVYDWNENQLLENTEPMEVVSHAGTAPLTVAAVNAQEMTQVAEIITMLLDKAPEHLVRFVEIAEEDDAEKARVLTAIEKGWPMLQDAYRIYHEKISPAMSNQVVMSLAAGWEVSELPEMPPPPQPLPLPEFAIACRLENAEQFVAGCAELYDVMDRFVDLVRELDPNSVPPNYTIPRPDEEALSTGTRYFYSAWAEQFPIDGFEPQVMVADDFVVFGYSSRQVDEMVAGGNPDLNIPWYGANDPVATVSYTNLAGFVRAIRPWAEFMLMLSGNDLDAPIAEADGPVPTGRDVLELWDTLTHFGEIKATSVIDEAGATVGRWTWQIQD